jgi:hypothetical protein
MLLRIGNPPSPLMCCPLENTESSQCGGPYRDFASFDPGGHGFYHQLTNFNSQPLMHFYEGTFSSFFPKLLIFQQHTFNVCFTGNDDHVLCTWTQKNGAKYTNEILSRAKKTGRQNHALTQWKMLQCKTAVNVNLSSCCMTLIN